VKASLYLPLLGFILPTVVIGYGFVIPRSCIAGVNELSIGFGVSILAASVTYLTGVRMALREGRSEGRPDQPR
jgi:ABC-type Fe3+ transport system permease subunit